MRKSKSVALITEENDHFRDVVFGLNEYILNNLIPQNVQKMKFWSDGCGSQFRSKFTFLLLTKYNPKIDIEWNYFEANHGKGAVDGIGGVVKNTVFRHVKANRVVVNDPKAFAEYADSVLPKISVIYVPDLNCSFAEEVTENALEVPGTLKVHQVKRVSSENKWILEFYYTSTSQTPFHQFSYVKDCKVAGSWVIIVYEGEHFPGKIVEVKENGMFLVSCLKKHFQLGFSYWTHFEKGHEDIGLYSKSDIVKSIDVPKLVPGNSRQKIIFEVPELIGRWASGI